MIGPFGGITAAAMVRAIESHPDRIGEPLALTVNFAAPIADGDFDISLRAARTNRTNQHWIVELSQNGCSCAAAASSRPGHLVDNVLPCRSGPTRRPGR